jgi:hypothetical protein
VHPYHATQLKSLAQRRNAKFAHLARNRPLSNNYEEVGVVGEWEFGRLCGQMPKEPSTRGGDGGWDFEVPVVFTVDVKTSRKGDVLLVEQGKLKADIYVLAHYAGDGDGETILAGWAFATQLKSVPPVDTGRGVVNHALPVAQLRPMAELERMMGKIRRG